MGGRGSGGGGGQGGGGAEGKVRAAYDVLATRPGAWVSLADLRDLLSQKGLSRAEQDRILTSLAVKPGVHVIPWDNFKALTARDRAAALHIGGNDSHAIRIERQR